MPCTVISLSLSLSTAGWRGGEEEKSLEGSCTEHRQTPSGCSCSLANVQLFWLLKANKYECISSLCEFFTKKIIFGRDFFHLSGTIQSSRTWAPAAMSSKRNSTLQLTLCTAMYSFLCTLETFVFFNFPKL